MSGDKDTNGRDTAASQQKQQAFLDVLAALRKVPPGPHEDTQGEQIRVLRGVIEYLGLRGVYRMEAHDHDEDDQHADDSGR